MPPGNSDDGLRAALDIRAMHPTQPIMVLSQYIADAYARELLTLPEGAIGHLLNIFIKLGLSSVEDNRRVRAVLTYLQAGSR